MNTIFSHLGYYNKNTIVCVAYKQKCISQILEAGKSEIKAPKDSLSDESPLPGS